MILRKVADKVRRYLWLRDQATSEPLRAYFKANHRIDVGLYSYGCFDEWRMPGPISVGRYCSIAKTARSVPINHPYTSITTHPALYEKKFGVVDEDLRWDDVLVIEDDVWIGHYAVVLPNCKFIGRGAIVGAGAIVTKDVPPYSIVAGNPARIIRKRFEPEVEAAVEASRWWEMSAQDLRAALHRYPEAITAPTVSSLAALIRAA